MNKAIALLGSLTLLVVASARRRRPPRWFGFNTYAPNAETLRHFADAGVNTVVCFPANVLSSAGVPYNNAYPPIWNGPGNYDFDCLDRQVTDKLAVNPKAKFIFFIDLNTPTWWCRIRGTRNPDSFNELGRVAASDVWRRDTREYLQAVLRHLESKHRDVIIGYFLACGIDDRMAGSLQGRGKRVSPRGLATVDDRAGTARSRGHPAGLGARPRFARPVSRPGRRRPRDRLLAILE